MSSGTTNNDRIYNERRLLYLRGFLGYIVLFVGMYATGRPTGRRSHKVVPHPSRRDRVTRLRPRKIEDFRRVSPAPGCRKLASEETRGCCRETRYTERKRDGVLLQRAPRSCTVFAMLCPMTPPQPMNTPVREGETIEGSRTLRNRPYPVRERESCLLSSHSVLKCSRRGARGNSYTAPPR